jgi:RNA polymerase sigma factor (sigma-70 family)
MTTAAGQDDFESEILALLPTLRRIAEVRLPDADAVEDVVQETTTRLMEVRGRLLPSSIAAYGAITVRNLILSLERDEERQRRHSHRLLDLSGPPLPEEIALREEEREATKAALAQLSSRDREVLIAHEVRGATTAHLARAERTTPGAIATRLARVRARMRLDYLLALRRVQLPTSRCRPVLLALSSGDKRAQESTGATEHLLDCRTCASLSSPLLRRRRPIAALLPLGSASKGLARYLRVHQHQALTLGGAGVVGAAIVIAVVANGNRPPEGPFVVQERRMSARAVGSADDYAGLRVVARGVRVLSVPSDEGFWVGTERDRVWVQLKTSGESRIAVNDGDMVTFSGRIVSHGDDFADEMLVQAPEGRALLLHQEQHIKVLEDHLRVK